MNDADFAAEPRTFEGVYVEPTRLVSKSQVETWQLCKRKFGLKYIAHIEQGQTAASALGDAVDSGQLQPYLTKGRPFDFAANRLAAEIASHAVASGLLPKPQAPGLECQTHLVVPSPSDALPNGFAAFAWHGYTDVFARDGALAHPGVGRSGVPLVEDFKTTKSFQWANSAEDLASDPQAVIYGVASMYLTNTRDVDLAWQYMKTQGGRKNHRVHLRVINGLKKATFNREGTYGEVPPEMLVERFEELDKVAIELRHAQDTIADAMQLPITPEACGAFGGCPYQHICNLGGGDKMDAQAATRARRNEGKEKPMSANPITNPTAGGALARIKAQREAALAAKNGGAPPMQPISIPNNQEVMKGSAPPPPATPVLVAPVGAVGINPEEKSLPPAPPIGSTEEEEDELDVDPCGVEAAVQAAAEAAPKATRTRKPKAEIVNVTNILASAPERVSATWGKEVFWPERNCSFEVGPFYAETIVRPGETATQALERINGELAAFAAAARNAKTAAFPVKVEA